MRQAIIEVDKLGTFVASHCEEKTVAQGAINTGKIADITIFDPNEEYVYTEDMIVSKSKNSPFIGKKLKGKVKYTIVGGRIVYGNNN